jgi:hypothetical protein
MGGSSWLMDEYITRQLITAMSMKRRWDLKEFKILFTVPVEDERILEIAKELGFKVSKRRGIVIEISLRR